jgi:hypothetical protein
MSREMLHELIDRIPDGEILAARRFLEYLASNPAYRAALAAPPDDEPVTSDDAEVIRKAGEDVRAGRARFPNDEVVREFGVK